MHCRVISKTKDSPSNVVVSVLRRALVQVAELWSKPAWLGLALLGQRKVGEASERNAVDCDVSAGERDGYAACVSPNMDIS